MATISAARKSRGLAGRVESLYELWLSRLGNPRSDASASILKRVDAKKWGRLWEAQDVFRLLDEFERELAIPEGGEKPARPAPRIA